MGLLTKMAVAIALLFGLVFAFMMGIVYFLYNIGYIVKKRW